MIEITKNVLPVLFQSKVPKGIQGTDFKMKTGLSIELIIAIRE